MTEPSYRALAEAALAVGRERTRILETLRLALLRGDDEDALRHARKLTGLEPAGTSATREVQ